MRRKSVPTQPPIPSMYSSAPLRLCASAPLRELLYFHPIQPTRSLSCHYGVKNGRFHVGSGSFEGRFRVGFMSLWGRFLRTKKISAQTQTSAAPTLEFPTSRFRHPKHNFCAQMRARNRPETVDIALQSSHRSESRQRISPRRSFRNHLSSPGTQPQLCVPCATPIRRKCTQPPATKSLQVSDKHQRNPRETPPTQTHHVHTHDPT